MIQSYVSVCIDCYMGAHNGIHESGGVWYVNDNDHPCEAKPLGKLADSERLVGDESDQHFSMQSCDTCESHLGGDRFTMVLIES